MNEVVSSHMDEALAKNKVRSPHSTLTPPGGAGGERPHRSQSLPAGLKPCPSRKLLQRFSPFRINRFVSGHAFRRAVLLPTSMRL